MCLLNIDDSFDLLCPLHVQAALERVYHVMLHTVGMNASMQQQKSAVRVQSGTASMS
jgi:hypothetical protein